MTHKCSHTALAGRTKRKISIALWDTSQFGNTALKHISVDNSQYKMQNYLEIHKTTDLPVTSDIVKFKRLYGQQKAEGNRSTQCLQFR